ncbi:metallophosphoesterase family protein [Meiothermus taiwanensis]|uniref:Nuclease SbcCD subunit D n=2 Tax=Meiothermus taiwanensis TaxID=172827 RepID=A0A399EB09_9DEIN|nr:exonuclease SbcCD subunit D [Meiothermus taiwanensis]AWR85977.1 exonuclease SbcD [Meiothermus taiwanensis WR-220]KZK15957.1 exonuclease SbcD [Meiothermus taiwanensis]RIH79521.1 Nuclease SbcCD subunit D [Meiothermus taiwanensis]
MRILHTADWHLGKVLKGRERTPEIRQALQELLKLVRSERIELVLVAGDLFDRSVVSTEAEAAAFEFFVGLRELQVPALVIAGNHDSRDRLEALSPLLSLTGATVFGNLRFAEDGGVVEALGAKVALLPFLSERRLVRAGDLLKGDSADWKRTYGHSLELILKNLATGFSADLNLLMAHLTVEGGQLGGGEFTFHTTNSYAIPKSAFPLSLSYVALGHLHRQQQVCEAPVAWYAGSLIQLDFGESENSNQGALIVELEPGQQPQIHPIRARWGRPLKTFRLSRETLDRRWEEIRTFPGYSKIVIEGPGNAALRERLFKELPDLLEVEFHTPEVEVKGPAVVDTENLDWVEAYAEYRRTVTAREASPELLQAFRQIYEEAHAPTH